MGPICHCPYYTYSITIHVVIVFILDRRHSFNLHRFRLISMAIQIDINWQLALKTIETGMSCSHGNAKLKICIPDLRPFS